MDLKIISFVMFLTFQLLTGCDATSILYRPQPCRLSRCPRGQLLDIATCRCVLVTQLPVNTRATCQNLFCPLALFPCTSYKTDTRGCKTCECRCFASVCPKHCPLGTEYTTDTNGCKVCKCRSQSVKHVCRNEPCGAFCPTGLHVDQFGCQLCRCKPKSCGGLCRNLCPFGRVMDAAGCPTCTCLDSPVGH
ncbi:unnamed protein product [Candidula unifasciata]|uniref:Antistasin-like domain-containing protein n=1 Tax=Candidula unifasciata TaxID=100452 RepID=A0A8S3ZCG4_9EUPU|nr:unnamed protein product [Candidula unifasciata]